MARFGVAAEGVRFSVAVGRGDGTWWRVRMVKGRHEENINGLMVPKYLGEE